MMNHKTITSSEIHVRSENVMRKWNHVFQKDVQHFLEDKELPYPSFQIIRQPNESILSKFPFWTYKRPAHCRPCWMILRENSPMIFVETRDPSRGYTARVPFDQGVVQKYGSICCEVYMDHQDRTVYVVDLLYWNHNPIYRTLAFHERWPLLNKVVYEVCRAQDCSDLNLVVPTFTTLSEMADEIMDPAVAIEFQPDTADRRRFLYIHREESRGKIREIVMRDVSQVQKASYGTAKVAARNTELAQKENRVSLVKSFGENKQDKYEKHREEREGRRDNRREGQRDERQHYDQRNNTRDQMGERRDDRKDNYYGGNRAESRDGHAESQMKHRDDRYDQKGGRYENRDSHYERGGNRAENRVNVQRGNDRYDRRDRYETSNRDQYEASDTRMEQSISPPTIPTIDQVTPVVSTTASHTPVLPGRSLPTGYFENAPTLVKKVVNALPPRKSKEISIDKSLTTAICKKDPISKLPDCYRLYDNLQNDIGLAALRLFTITQKIRTVLETSSQCKVSIAWHEPFGKFEIKDVLVE